MVEDVEEALMEGQTGAKHGGQDDFVVRCVGLGLGQRRLYGLFGIVQRLAHLVGHQLTDALQVEAEGASVGLNLDVSQLSHILVDDAVAICKIDDVHGS